MGSEGLLRVQDVAAALKLSVRQIWKLANSSRLPAPFRVGGSRSVRWREADIAAFIEAGCSMGKLDAEGPERRAG